MFFLKYTLDRIIGTLEILNRNISEVTSHSNSLFCTLRGDYEHEI